MKSARKLFRAGAKVLDSSSAVAYYAAINCFVYYLFLKKVVLDGSCCRRSS